MAAPWFRNLFSTKTRRPARPRRAVPYVRTTRLSLEQLEDRLAPASFNIPNFFGNTTVVRNGSTTLNGSSLELTDGLTSQIGSAYYGLPIVLTPSTTFSTTFDFRMNPFFAGSGGDGLAFVLQNTAAGATSLGTSGGNGEMGYSGISPSVALQFDTFQNSFPPTEPTVPYAAFLSNGNLTPKLLNTSPLPSLNDGITWTVTLTYSPTAGPLGTPQYSATLVKPVLPATTVSFVMNGVANLYSTVGSRSFVGFTAASPAAFPFSGQSQEHDIDSWSFSADDVASTTQVIAPTGTVAWGSNVTFQASVQTSAGDPVTSGVMIFYVDGSLAGTGLYDSSTGLFQTTLNNYQPTPGTHSIQAQYVPGPLNLQGSFSNTGSFTVQTTTSTAITASATSRTYNQPVNFTAFVTSAAGSVPTGSVTFFNNGVALAGAVALNGAGQATLSNVVLTPGTYNNIFAVYSGGVGFQASTSAPVSPAVVVSKAGTTVALASSVFPANQSVFGQPVTFTATVNVTPPGGGSPTGTVTFFDGGVAIPGATNVPLSGTQAAFTTSGLAVGGHTLTATYSGDGNFNASPVSNSVLNPVIRAGTTAAVVSSAAPSNTSELGQAVTFTATVSVVSPGGGTPTGTVSFFDNSAPITGGANVPLSGTQAAFSISTLAFGTHTITAVYNGDGNFTASPPSPGVGLNVTLAGTVTTITSFGPSPAAPGQTVTFQATVNRALPGAGTPTGTVTFLDGGAPLPNGTVTLSGNVATLTTSFAAPGSSHTITARYDPDSASAPIFLGSLSPAVTQTVTPAATTTTLVPSPASSAFQQPVTLTAQVSSNYPGTPTGTVTFFLGGNSLGTVNLSGGTASLSTANLPVGVNSLTATYSGDATYAGSSTASPSNYLVNPAPTATALAASVAPSAFQQVVLLTATVTVPTPGGGSPVAPTGTVSFYDNNGTTLLGTSNLVSGSATYSTAALGVGSHALVARYNGDGNFNSSTSSALTQTVNQAATSIAIASTINPSVINQPGVSFTVTVGVVSPGSISPTALTGLVTLLDGGTPIGTFTLAAGNNGVATITPSSPLAVGGHSLTATYAGDGNFQGSSTAAPFTQTVNKGTTTTGVSSSAVTTVFGQSVTFTATVGSNQAWLSTPTGTVTFFQGTTPLSGPIGLNGSGSATFTTSALPVGIQVITAFYNGDNNFSTSSAVGSVQTPFSQTVNQNAVALSVSSSLNPSVFGQSVTLTAQVTAAAPGSGTPTGTVTFFDGATALGPAATLAGGVATLATSALAVGSHTITFSYGGDTNFTAATMATTSPPALAQVVNQIGTLTSLTLTTPTAVFQQSVPLTATVSAVAPGTGTPTGTVTFFDGLTQLGAPVTLSNGSATLNFAALAVGNHAITATYNGSTNFAGSNSAAGVERVNPAAATVAVTSSLNPSLLGQSVTFTVAVGAAAPGAAAPIVPTGQVTVFDGGQALTTLNLASGSASFSLSTLAAGGHALTATYTGDANFLAGNSTATPFTQTVNKGTTSTAVTSGTNPAVFGESVTLTATVTANQAGLPTPTGTVTFFQGTTQVGTPVTLNGAGTAALTTTALPVGALSITAYYNGDANFNNSGATGSVQTALSQTVNRAGSAAAVTSSLSPAVVGQAITFTAQVTAAAPGSGTPTGTVTFFAGVTALGPAVALTNGSATLSTSALAVGTYNIRADYSGDGNFTVATSAPLTQFVIPSATTTTLALGTATAVFQQLVKLTATVAAVVPGTGTPDGSVTFFDGTTPLGAALPLNSGAASLDLSSLSVGSHSITAVYSGATNYAVSTSAAAIQMVNAAATSLTVTSSVNPSTIGAAVTFTIAVAVTSPGASSPIAPTGTVTVFDGTTALGTATLTGGSATFSTSALAAGAHTIAVTYAGDGNFQGANTTAGPLTQTVNKGTTTTSLTSSADPSVFGEAVTLTATAAANQAGAPTPTGTVTFFQGHTQLGDPVPLNAAGVATLTTTALAVGNLPLTAYYNGDGNFGTSGAAGSVQTALAHTVDRAAAVVTVTSSLSPAVVGQAITFTVTVRAAAPGSGTPTGTVAVFAGATQLGFTMTLSGGTATLTTSALPVGTHVITVRHSGDGNFVAATSAPLTQTVTPSATMTTLALGTATAVFQQLVTLTATVAAVAPGTGTPTGSVTFFDGGTQLGAAVPLNNGAASLGLSSLTVGSHSITAVYGGATNYTVSTSAAAIQMVNAAATSLTITSDVNPSTIGTLVTFTVAVAVTSPAAATPIIPSGAVTVFDGTTALGTVSLANGAATFSTSALAAGAHAITVTYAGDGNFQGANTTASPLTQTVNKGTTTTSLTASAEPSVFGEAVTLTATAAANQAGAPTPTGTVTFFQGHTQLGDPVPLNAAGVATLTTTALAVGNLPLTAYYNGDGNFGTSGAAGSVQTALAHTVDRAAADMAVSSSLNPATAGQSVTLTAQVTAAAPGSGTPSGTVTFFDGTTPLGSAVTLANGSATLTTSALAVGTHGITVSYSGDGNFTVASSSAFSQRVSAAATTTTLTLASPTAVFQQLVSLTAAVAAVPPGTGTPTGNVTFLDGGTQIGAAVPLSNGSATLNFSGLSVGSHSITAVYRSSAAAVAGSSSTAGVLAVNPATPTIAVGSDVNPSLLGQAVTFTITVGAAAPGAATPVVPTGQVTVFDGTTALGTVALVNGTASFIPSPNLAAGAHSITVSYTGDDSFAAGSTATPFTQTVNKGTTTTSLTSYLNPTVFGQLVTLTATVTPNQPGLGTPTGSVAFFNAGTQIGTANLLANGTATLDLTSLPNGNLPLTVSYNGDNNFGASSTTGSVQNLFVQTVNPVTTSLALSSSLNPANFGQAVTITAKVSVDAPGSGAPTGTVTFFVNGVVQGSPAALTNGSATFAAALPAGDQVITATYTPDVASAPSFIGSTAPALTQTVNLLSATLTLAASGTSAVPGQPVAFVATVQAPAGTTITPTGSVTFMDGSTALSTVTLANGSASFETTSLAAGTHPVTAVYTPDAASSPAYQSGTSPAVTVIVTPITTITQVSSSGSPSTFQQSVSFLATVATNPGVILTGTLTFADGSTTLGVVPLSNNQATFSTAGLFVGTHTVTAAYTPDATSFQYAASSATLTQQVNRASIYAVGADAGAGPEVRVFAAANHALIYDFFAYDASFTGGVRVATGDVNNDGYEDIIVAAGPGGGPNILIVSGADGRTPIRNFFAYDPAFGAGLYVAAGDVNGDGFADIITGADAGGGPNVGVFDGKSIASGQPIIPLTLFFPYAMTFTGGVRVGAGDVNGDGFDDFITGAGPGGGPNVAVFDGTTAQPLAGPLGSFFPFAMNFTGGVYVAAGDVNGDGLDDVVAGAGLGGGPNVLVINAATGTALANFMAYPTSTTSLIYNTAVWTSGVRVGTADQNGDGRLDVVTGGGPQSAPQVKVFDALSQTDLDSFFAYDSLFRSGVFIGGSRDV